MSLAARKLKRDQSVKARDSAFRANEEKQSYAFAVAKHSLLQMMPDPGSFAAS
jgi:hypothetical protein